MTPVQRMDAANWMSTPVSSSIVSTLHCRPPYMYDELSIWALMAELLPPSSVGHDGMGTIMSRGNETTVTRRGESLMFSSIVTSLRSPPSSCAHRGKSSRSWPSHESVPTTSMLTPPSISPIVGGSEDSSSPIETPLSCRARAASHTAKAPTAPMLIASTATTAPRICSTWTNGCGEERMPCRATGCRRCRDALAAGVGSLTGVLSQTAEGVGFEPTGHCCPPVFKTGSFGRSDNPPDGRQRHPTNRRRV